MKYNQIIRWFLMYEMVCGNITVQPHSINGASEHAAQQLELLGATPDPVTFANTFLTALTAYGINLGARVAA